MTATPDFIVIADFHVLPGHRARFLEHAHEDAHQSLTNEPDCHQFDVLVPVDDENRVTLFEAYTDREAFDAHTRMPHYQPFQEGITPLLADEPRVRFFQPG